MKKEFNLEDDKKVNIQQKYLLIISFVLVFLIPVYGLSQSLSESSYGQTRLDGLVVFILESALFGITFFIYRLLGHKPNTKRTSLISIGIFLAPSAAVLVIILFIWGWSALTSKPSQTSQDATPFDPLKEGGAPLSISELLNKCITVKNGGIKFTSRADYLYGSTTTGHITGVIKNNCDYIVLLPKIRLVITKDKDGKEIVDNTQKYQPVNSLDSGEIKDMDYTFDISNDDHRFYNWEWVINQ